MSVFNRVRLIGTVLGDCFESYQCYQRSYCIFMLGIKRLSGCIDLLPIHALSDACLPFISNGEGVLVEGELRSCNREEEGRRRLVLYTYAKSLRPSTAADENDVCLEGQLCSCPVIRQTPFGKCIADGLIAVVRPNGRVDFIPLIFWGQSARRAAYAKSGTRLTVTGRLQSREYIKRYENGEQEKRTAFEVSVSQFSLHT